MFCSVMMVVNGDKATTYLSSRVKMQTAAVETTPKAKPPKKAEAAPRASLSSAMARSHRRFAEAMFEHGDITKAYLESHPDCKSIKSANYRGRVMLKLGSVRAYILELKAKSSSNPAVESNPKKAALLAELDMVAYASINLKKLHPKEKLTALRTIAEIEGWMKPPSAGAHGVRATFNFRIGGNSRIAAGRTITIDADNRPEGEQEISVDVEAAPMADLQAIENGSLESRASIDAPASEEKAAPAPSKALFDASNT